MSEENEQTTKSTMEPAALGAFQCPKCTKAFRSQPALNTHNARMHAGTKKRAAWAANIQRSQGKKFQCPKCERSFGTAQAMRIHKTRMHAENGQAQEVHETQPVHVASTGHVEEGQHRVAAVVNVPIGVCFCPKCGFDIRALQATLNQQQIF